MKYLYCRDENLYNTLLSKNMKLLNTMSSSNGKTWIFEYDPSLFCLNFENKEIKQKCHLSDKLIMSF